MAQWFDFNEVTADDENPLIDLALRLGPPVSNPTVANSVAGNGENSSTILPAMNPSSSTATATATANQFTEVVLALPAPSNWLRINCEPIYRRDLAK